MVAPSGQNLMKQYPKVSLTCEGCFEIGPNDIIQPAASVPQILREARTARPNMRRHRN
jgi:hypothetical protein